MPTMTVIAVREWIRTASASSCSPARGSRPTPAFRISAARRAYGRRIPAPRRWRRCSTTWPIPKCGSAPGRAASDTFARPGSSPTPAIARWSSSSAAATLHTLITQNVDGLHRRPARRRRRSSRSTAPMREVVCLDCGERAPMERALARVRAGEEDPACRSCGGILKSATISFGQGLVQERPACAPSARRASCDLLLAVGSTLAVYPIAGVVPVAKRAGARVVIINAEPTEMDEIADAVLRGSISEILPRLVASATHSRSSGAPRFCAAAYRRITALRSEPAPRHASSMQRVKPARAAPESADDVVRRDAVGRRRLVVAVPDQHRAHAGAIGAGDILRERVADEQRLAGRTAGAAQGFVEDRRIGFARRRPPRSTAASRNASRRPATSIRCSSWSSSMLLTMPMCSPRARSACSVSTTPSRSTKSRRCSVPLHLAGSGRGAPRRARRRRPRACRRRRRGRGRGAGRSGAAGRRGRRAASPRAGRGGSRSRRPRCPAQRASAIRHSRSPRSQRRRSRRACRRSRTAPRGSSWAFTTETKASETPLCLVSCGELIIRACCSRPSTSAPASGSPERSARDRRPSWPGTSRPSARPR